VYSVANSTQVFEPLGRPSRTPPTRPCIYYIYMEEPLTRSANLSETSTNSLCAYDSANHFIQVFEVHDDGQIKMTVARPDLRDGQRPQYTGPSKIQMCGSVPSSCCHGSWSWRRPSAAIFACCCNPCPSVSVRGQ
jgi:hypothetical protein